MMHRTLIILSLIAFSSCSVKRYLPDGERLYRGATINVNKHPETSTSKRQLKRELRVAATPRPNKFLFGQPWKVWWWYVIGEPRKEKGLKAFLRNRLGEPPVLSSRVNPEAVTENMEALMENLGYFHTTAEGDTVNKNYFTRAIYDVNVQPQYHFSEITWVTDSSAIMQLLEQEQKRGLLKVGDPYRLSNITAERDRLDLFLKTRGYYFFNPDYLMAYADSTVGDRKVKLFLNLKKSRPEEAVHPYSISKITVFPNYTLASDALDTTHRVTEIYDSLHIRDTTKKFRSKLFAHTITYRPGMLYSSRDQNSTLNRFINLGAFKFVKNKFEPEADTVGGRKMEVFYYLTPEKKKSIQAAIDAFSKENNYLGTQVSVNWRNRNAMRGAEQLNIRSYGGIETSFADSLKRNNNFRLGAEATLRIPRYAIPFLNIRENNFYPPNTTILLGYELMRKQLFYSKHLFRAQYEFTWKRNFRNQYTFAPISLSYLNASHVTDTFVKQALVTPSLFLNVYDEAILGTFFSYTYNDTRPNLRNRWYLNGSVDLSGNIAGLITGAKSFREKKIFGTPFAQYVKTDLNIHFTRAFKSGWSLANRIQIGVGMPYNNSALLPFAKQYIIGGSSSLRGFTVRSIGPGTYKPTFEDQRFFQIIGGDYKILGNTELRIPFNKSMSGALFLDAGNIWTKDTLLFGTQGQFSKDWFKELAVNTGFGLRFDFTVLLLRVDLGIPLRKPYLPENDRWVIDEINFLDREWRRENLVLNIALGYPF